MTTVWSRARTERYSEADGLRTYCGGTRGSNRSFLQRTFESVSELPQTLRGAGNDRECQRQTAQDLSLVCDAVGDSAPVAGLGTASAAGNFQRRVGTKSECSKRHTGRRKHASRQTKTVRENTSQADRLSMEGSGALRPVRGSAPTPAGAAPLRPAPKSKPFPRSENIWRNVLENLRRLRCGCPIEISNQKGGPTAELRSSSRLIVRL